MATERDQWAYLSSALSYRIYRTVNVLPISSVPLPSTDASAADVKLWHKSVDQEQIRSKKDALWSKRKLWAWVVGSGRNMEVVAELLL